MAARVLWLDAFTANVDRTWRNPNLLLWHGDLWVIDHGAALYFHHAWAGGVDRPGAVRRPAVGRRATTCSAPHAAGLRGASTPSSAARSTDDVFAEVLAAGARRVARAGARAPRRPDALRAAYVDFLAARLGDARQWLPGASAA